MSIKIDPITRSVVRHRFSAIVEEMGEAMLRTSYSQILNSSARFLHRHYRPRRPADRAGRAHPGACRRAALGGERARWSAFPDDRAARRRLSCSTTPITAATICPTSRSSCRSSMATGWLFWSIDRAHQSDIGGATHGAYNPAATEIWQEGLRIPPMRLYESGVLREDLLEMLALNVRHPRDFRGDLAAMIGSARLGERRLCAAARRIRRSRAARPRSRRCWTPPNARRAPSSRPGRMASTRARRSWTTTATGAGHPHPRQGHQERQRSHGRPDRLRPAGRPASSIPRTPTCSRRW